MAEISRPEILAEASGGQLHVHSENAFEFGPPWSFTSLLHPISPRRFCAKYWGKCPLHIIHGNSDHYRRLVSLAEIEQYLSVDELFVRHSVTTPFRGEGPTDEPPFCLSELFERLAQGKPLRLRRLETLLHPAAPIIALLRDMETMLQHPKASLSCYIAPPSGLGLGPHHDETEIFTLQIAGAKRWRLFHKVTADQPRIYEPAEMGDATHEFSLEAGDLLYVPGGYVHDVSVLSSEPSFSVTIVFEPFRWRTALDLLVARLHQTSAFIEPLPAGPLLEDVRGDAFSREFKARIAMIREELAKLTEDELADALAARHLQRMTLPADDRLGSIFQLDKIGLDTRMEKSPKVACRLVRSDDRIRLVLPGGYTLQAGAGAERAIQDILASKAPFRVSDMHRCLSAPAKVALAKRLVGCGLLRVLRDD